MNETLLTERYSLKIKIVEAQFDLLYTFTRSLAYYRAIHHEINKVTLNFDFWCHSMNAHLLKAVTDWCIIFGPDSNEAHWKKTTQDNRQEFINEIRGLILTASKFSKKEWADYQSTMVDFRHKYIAHRQPECTIPVPQLDNAFLIAVTYFDYLKEQFWPFHDQPESLNILYSRFKLEALEVLKPSLNEI